PPNAPTHDASPGASSRGASRGIPTPGPPPRRAGRTTQRDGRVALEALAPLGRLTPAQARALADTLADTTAGTRAGDGPAIRFTPWRTAVCLDLTPGEADRAERALTGSGLVTDPASPWAGVTACTGRPGCAKALADVQADARRWVQGLAHPPDAPDRAAGTPVHWAGCERRCGLPRGPVVALIATGDGYRRGRPR
ncbi:nitrite reductase, partial [Nonomuraea sp. MG754425]|nr:nitrite reductase [Nonomuraea sp. MG754425]